MDDSPSAPNNTSPPPDIVHLVGELTPVVLSYLQPATQALDAAGFVQHVVVVCKKAPDLPEHAFGKLTRVDLVTSRSRLNRWAKGIGRLNSLLGPNTPAGVHLHGFVAFCLGGISLRREGYLGRLYYSPHGSRAHGKHGLLGSLAYALVSPWIGGSSFLMIADSVGDPANKLPAHEEVVEAIANPVDDAFLNTEHIDAPEALVVGGATEPNTAELNAFSQMAVMLPRSTAAGTPIKFFWIGPVQAAQEAMLKAAEITWVAPSDQRARIELLCTAWVFLAPIGGRGYPMPMAQAMACGTPCVALRCTEHTLLIADNKDGLLFDSASHGMALVAELLDQAAKRQALGLSAQHKLRATRTRQGFASKVLPLYEDATTVQTDVHDTVL